jgi:(1->4)-alpha-D-glucan 1-alpha-D-glucosylmutase
MPDANDEYLLYQTLVGTYPFHTTPEAEDYRSRLKDYMLKAIREAKVHSSWAGPNKEYEKALMAFIDGILDDGNFLKMLTAFLREVAEKAVLLSLSQTLLKLSVPGVPDIYQGSELWDLSMVDPDNRRPVDYDARQQMLDRLENDWRQAPLRTARKLCRDFLQPDIKLFTLYQGLKARQQYLPIFSEGSYQPLATAGTYGDKVMAFLRKNQNNAALVVVPLRAWFTRENENLPPGETDWQDTYLEISQESHEWQCVFTQKKFTLASPVRIAELLSDFPLCMLIKQ